MFCQLDRSLFVYGKCWIVSSVEDDKELISQMVRQQEKEGTQIAGVTVTDTGCGIDPAIMPRIFKKFVTGSDKGKGLEMFVSKNIIQAHEGRIWVQNNAERATFCFTLPRK
jgi:two-component system, OmpR family, sensor histidine kinase VicK